jgi:hypothetical protein
MSSDFNDISRELKAFQNDLDEANFFLSKNTHVKVKREKSLNRSLVTQDKVTKEIYVYLERLFRITYAHLLQMIDLYESIMSLPEVQANEQLQKDIRARFQAARDTQF